ncbi:MAG: MogA/MoaB family molybdenum cofactor biosynthesis protein [Candidatus Aminicenantes bacterium]|nr:MogA/MoaB family molybdenum cofactor biosynthesis protein [Candidatus Aminicenantes bacterium]
MSEKKNNLKDLIFALVIISDRSSRGERKDLTGPELKEFLEANGAKINYLALIPDEKDIIVQRLMELCESEEPPEIILTAGGTGLSPRDVTPEATKKVIEKEIPGIAEAMRLKSLASTPSAMLSRAVAGVRQKTLIINLPGSPKAARENLEAIMSALPHAVEIIRGKISDCQQSSSKERPE